MRTGRLWTYVRDDGWAPQLDLPGSDEGGRRAAALYTLIATAKLNDEDPHAWLADVLARILDYPADRRSPTPWGRQAERHAAA